MEIILDIIDNSSYKITAFRKSTVQVLQGFDVKHNAPLQQNVLVLAPGPVFESPKLHEFETIFLILNSSSTPSQITDLASKSRVVLVIRGALIRNILNSQDPDDWERALNLCHIIYCPKPYIQSLQRITDAKVRNFSNQVTRLWGFTGEPNLLQVTLGLALQESGPNSRLWISGATFYAHSQVYASDKKAPSGIQSGRFSTCQNLAKHDPAVNFTVTKRLLSMYEWEGDSFAKHVLSKSLEDYLVTVDQNIGLNRL